MMVGTAIVSMTLCTGACVRNVKLSRFILVAKLPIFAQKPNTLARYFFIFILFLNQPFV